MGAVLAEPLEGCETLTNPDDIDGIIGGMAAPDDWEGEINIPVIFISGEHGAVLYEEMTANGGSESISMHCGDNEIGCSNWDFHMTDTYGNGWDCAYVDIYDCDDNLLVGGIDMPAAEGEACDSWDQHDEGYAFASDVCLPESEGYTLVFTSGFWDGEIGWELIDPSGITQLAGGAPGTFSTCGDYEPEPDYDDTVDFCESEEFNQGEGSSIA